MEFYAGDVFNRGYMDAITSVGTGYNCCALGAASHSEGYNAGVVSTNYVGPIVNKGLDIEQLIIGGIGRLRRADLKTLR